MNNPFMNNPNAPAPTPVTAPAMPGQSVNDANMGFEVDLTDVQETSFIVPDGTYKALCIDVTQDVSKSGNPMFIWEFQINEGPYKGKTFKSWTAITPAAMWKVAETVQALGVGQTGQVVKFKKGDVLNKPCGIVMEQDEYNGRPTSRISRVISLEEMANIAAACEQDTNDPVPF
nr:MAG TPA: hypothetical protein [Caudoviricetes sp.]